MSKPDWPANKIEMRNVSELVSYANNSRSLRASSKIVTQSLSEE